MNESSPLRANEAGLEPPVSRSTAAFLREQAVVPGGSMRHASWFPPHPPYAARGEGCWIVDIDGRRILDCANNFFSLVHGHAFPPIVEALTAAIGRGTAFGLPTEGEIALAEALAARNPNLAQTRFCNSGTEALLGAVKGARGATGRHRIAKFEGCYHGSYDHMEVSLESTPENWDDAEGNPASVPYAKGTPPAVLADTVVLPYADADRCAAILRKHGPTLAAIVLDPHASKAGMVAMPAEVVAVVQDACARDGILLIVDEVVNFRLGFGGISPAFGLRPDFVTLGKIIGGGLPVGAVSGPASAMAVFDHAKGKPKVALGGTFSANPLTMAAGLASLTHYDAAAVARLNALGDALRAKVNAGFAAAGVAARLGGMGSLFRLHLGARQVVDYRSARPLPAEAAALPRIHAAMLAAGVLLTPNCSGALSTPMTEAEIALIADRFVQSTLATEA
ncbi:aspartate aminotransferase family protein [Neoroseomonas oryzicola]|uniref:Aminotransferase class III-fold pyridoxal phosphate-dependent enzyme n=1 Tax=Neoroseomonas oryzicola TaxID=535904 RepID=A0A9X9WKK8_9PROT|nr:aminotransferase class III-fold pyridoxal phosphate-dependent enzyme [Neoroseomonas oryzicola]MBR0660868.1 aminotransferase class III-fold pyridoxal phosphate-dependent enzyme [Neoroseomonas oryzicola]NKE19880.1 aminotransferase class III-fold pyridoxal phosphate-dependent enzyme [Neoroseomonas oryzicola]